MVEITKLLFNNSFLSDVQFEIDGQLIYAHSLELMKRSIVFQKQLIINLGENKLVPINDVSYDTFYQFIRFIYTDECDIDAEIGLDLLKLAIQYKVTRLENKLIDFFCVEPRCLKLYEFCVTQNYQIPKNRVQEKLASKLREYLAHDSFDTVHPDVVEGILKMDYVGDDMSEIEIFDVLMRWINKYCKNTATIKGRDPIIERLVQLIRFPTMTLEEFGTCIPKLETILSDSDCGMILKKITSGPAYEIAKWNAKPRMDYYWSMHGIRLESETVYKLTTIFSVTKELFFVGVWCGIGRTNKVVLHVEITAKSVVETIQIDVIKFRLHSSEYSCFNLNSLGDGILLKPNIEYTMQMIYECNRFSLIYYRPQEIGVIVTAPSNSVVIREASRNIFELIFKLPA